MSQYPNKLDTDVDLPRVDDNIVEIGATAINALRDATFAIEANLGLALAGNESDLATRLSVSIDANGNIKPSALAALALTPIVDAQVSNVAAIKESKLALDHKTADLYNSIITNNGYLQTALAFISGTGSKVEPHIAGSSYNHTMTAILVDNNSINYFKNLNNVNRNNTNLYTLFNDINNDLIAHEKADSTNFGSTAPYSPSVGTVPPTNYAHVAAGIYLNTSNFSFIPQTANDVQQFAQFIDNANIFLLGTRIQTLYANGIPRTARSGTLLNADLGQSMVPLTPAMTYLLYGGSTAPFDDIDHGDDLVEFFPDLASITNSTFDAKFNLVRVGDILTTVYDGYNITVSSIIKEKKLIVSGGNKRYVVRLDSKNLMDGYFHASINKPLFNINKYGVLALAQANTPMNVLPSLIAGQPRGAQVLGLGFNADQIDSAHYNLYLQLYPTGNPADKVVNLAAIDITGNQGQTPGEYTLDSIVASTNAAFRTAGYNYRFIAYSNQGQFGIMLAEPYNNTSFSIVSGVLASSGLYDNSLSNTSYPNNIIGVPGFDSKDALGFGPANANLGSPPYSATFANSTVAQTPTRLFVPLTRNNYYVNGVERERIALEVHQILDGYGDGYWPAIIEAKTIVPGIRVEVTYQVNADLSSSNLQVGKTLVVQDNNVVDSGRFFIKSIQFNNCNLPSAYTLITVWDAIHSTGSTPFASSGVGAAVGLYFNGDSIGFNIESATDFSTAGVPFKRHFEIYIDDNGHTFSHERGRMNIRGTNATINGITLYSTSELSHFGLYNISPKLRGYDFSSVTKINLQITSYDSTTGIYTGYLCKWDGTTVTNQGPVTVGKKGSVTRFYDQTNIEYIEFILDSSEVLATFNTTKTIDVQLFPTLQLDEEIMLLGTTQVNDSTFQLLYLLDKRQFGNVSEEQLTTSALSYISAPTRLLMSNGIIQGFDFLTLSGNNITFNGGIAVVNGKIIQLGVEVVGIPVVQETLSPFGQNININTITWFACINDKGEIELVASTDFDPTTSSSTYDLAGVDHTRIFYAQNPNAVSPTPYQVRATFLADLVTNDRDLTPIAVITTTISSSGGVYSISAATTHDARRFVYNGYGGLIDPFVFGSDASFRSFDSLNAWLVQLLNFKSAQFLSNNVAQKVIVKGNTTLTSSVTLGYNLPVIFEGDGGTFTISTIKTGFNLGSNIAFNNITFVNAYDPIANSDPDYNSALLSNNLHAFLYCNVDGTNGNSGIKITNCRFNSALQNRYPFIVFNFSSDTCYAEDILIDKNKFTTTFAADDRLAVLAFIGPATNLGVANGARLINCHINNNYCNKNQIMHISGIYSAGAGKILDLIAAVNVQFVGNTCGAIGVSSKYDVPSSTFNTTFTKDKDNGVLVQGNTCPYIYNSFSDGTAQNGSGQRMVQVLNTGIFTGALTISDNIGSFIHVGMRVPTSYASSPPNLIIRHNRLFARDSSAATGYLNPYWGSFIAPTFTFTSTAIILDKVVGS